MLNGLQAFKSITTLCYKFQLGMMLQVFFYNAPGKSFVIYDGSWTITPQDSGTELVYELTAKPAFSVPGMVLRKLLDRDARETIEGLRAEIALRASSR